MKDFPPKIVETMKSVLETADFPLKEVVRQLNFTEFSLPLTIASKHSSLPPRWKPKSNPTPTASLSTKSESPRPHLQANTEVKGDTLKGHKRCHCKHSKCLKLYCLCFSLGIFCDGCNCDDCHNNVENEAARQAAVEITLERNPKAFLGHGQGTQGDRYDETNEIPVVRKQNKGCYCKKSECLKKYCECFLANTLCHENCKCMDCKNCEGCEETVVLDKHSSINTHIEQANVATAAAIGFSGYCSSKASRKRKSQELFLDLNGKDSPIHKLAQYQRVNDFKALGPISDLPVVSVGQIFKSPVSGASKFTYRSSLADTIRPQDTRRLCSLLVVVAEATKIHAGNERLVMACFRDCLHRLIYCGQVKETKCSSSNTETTSEDETDGK